MGTTAPLLLLLSLLPSSSSAAPAAPTNRPWALADTGSPPDAFGTDGFDVSIDQSVAQRFVASTSGPLSGVSVYLMSNGDGQPPLPLVSVSLVAGGMDSPAPGSPLESWWVPVTANGFNPTRVDLNSSSAPSVSVGDVLWVVLSSNSSSGENGVWCMSNAVAFGTTTSKGAWQPGAAGNAAAFAVWAASAPMGPKGRHSR